MYATHHRITICESHTVAEKATYIDLSYRYGSSGIKTQLNNFLSSSHQAKNLPTPCTAKTSKVKRLTTCFFLSKTLSKIHRAKVLDARYNVVAYPWNRWYKTYEGPKIPKFQFHSTGGKRDARSGAACEPTSYYWARLHELKWRKKDCFDCFVEQAEVMRNKGNTHYEKRTMATRKEVAN